MNIEVIWGTFETYPKRFKMVDGSQDFTCFLFQTSINVLIKMYQMKCVCDKMGKKKNRHDHSAGYSRAENISQESVVELGAVLLRETTEPRARSMGGQSSRGI